MPKIVFAAISPHPPLILPNIGSKEDRAKVNNTTDALDSLRKKINIAKPDSILISAPHQDWGFNVPLHFIAPDFKGEIQKYLADIKPPEFYFNEGKRIYGRLPNNKKFALIASGDMSHVLKEDGPYGFNPQGPRFDADFIKYLKNRDVKKILRLNDDYPEAAECGLGSFCFMLGILEAAKISWESQVLAYEGPFGVGYLVVDFILRQ